MQNVVLGSLFSSNSVKVFIFVTNLNTLMIGGVVDKLKCCGLPKGPVVLSCFNKALVLLTVMSCTTVRLLWCSRPALTPRADACCAQGPSESPRHDGKITSDHIEVMVSLTFFYCLLFPSPESEEGLVRIIGDQKH